MLAEMVKMLYFRYRATDEDEELRDGEGFVSKMEGKCWCFILKEEDGQMVYPNK